MTSPTSKRSTTSRPGSRASNPPSALTDSNEDVSTNWIVALVEGKGREIGVVAIQVDTHKVVVTQYPDTPTFVKTMHLFTTRSPSLILVPVTALGSTKEVGQLLDQQNKGEATMLVKCLKDTFKGVGIVGVARKLWSEQAGFEFLQQLMMDDEERTGTIVAIKPKYFALSAIAALFKYLETTRSQYFPPRSLWIRYAPLDGTMLIDMDTAANLELVANLINQNSKQHLLGLLNHCFTPMGTRLLRTNILSPLTDTTVIDTRLDAVEEFVGSEERFHAVRKALESLRGIDIDKLIGQVASSQQRRQSLGKGAVDPAKASEGKISRLLQLRRVLQALPALRSALHNSTSALLQMIENILSDDRTQGMLEVIASTLNEDAEPSQKGTLQTRNTRIYAIKADKKLLLDVARETYKENTADAHEISEQMTVKHGIDIGLYYAANGFVFTCKQIDLDEHKTLPKMFTNVTKKGKSLHFSSMELHKKNARIQESVQEIFLMSDEILDEVFEEIQTSIAALYRCAEAIAMLDMLAAFADVASRLNYVRPEWTGTLAIKGGRHPLYEYYRLSSDGTFVPNDTYASDAATFQLVFGVNMSGKSTLLKQIALLYVMAQIGCYVPAEYASFRVIDALLSRLSNDDSIEASLSTFAKEMSTMSMIMSSMAMIKESGRECLIIIDELGRGTSPREGVGIAHALAEAIIESKSICFFATHFKELALTLGHYPNVVSLHLQTDIDPSQTDFSLTFHHRVVDGTSPHSHYGLELAKLAKLPLDVHSRASFVSHQLESLAEAGKNEAHVTKLAQKRRALLRSSTSLRELRQARGITAKDLRRMMKKLQDETVLVLSKTLLNLSTSDGIPIRSYEEDEVDDDDDTAGTSLRLKSTPPFETHERLQDSQGFDFDAMDQDERSDSPHYINESNDEVEMGEIDDDDLLET